MSEKIHKFTEVEKLKVDTLMLKRELLNSQMQNLNLQLDGLMEYIRFENSLGPKENITILHDFTGFSIKNQECQVSDGGEESVDDV